jgi:hypothetical protein
MPEPLVTLKVLRADEVASTFDNVLQTPTTPVSPKALTSLHNLIKQDSAKLNEQSQQRLRKHVQKLANAAQTSFAKCTLLQDQNHFLYKINSEANVRRSTRRVVLGKAKVMSFKDLEKACAKRAEKLKRGRKRKNIALEEGMPRLEIAMVRTAEVLMFMLEPEPESEPTSWRAPVARMY